MTGLERRYEKEELQNILIRQNNGIRSVFEGDIADDEDKLLEVLAVVLQQKNKELFKAIL